MAIGLLFLLDNSASYQILVCYPFYRSAIEIATTQTKSARTEEKTDNQSGFGIATLNHLRNYCRGNPPVVAPIDRG
jgi:hypothetical protein